MNIEKRIFDFCIWLVAASVFLAVLSSCNPYQGLQTATQTAIAGPTSTTEVARARATSSPTPYPTCTVATGVPAGYLNIRSGPGVQYAVIGLLREEETLTVITRGDWLEVETAQHQTGFVNSRYCK
jgi:N-acetylmuramoyl-L-alanine amidase